MTTDELERLAALMLKARGEPFDGSPSMWPKALLEGMAALLKHEADKRREQYEKALEG